MNATKTVLFLLLVACRNDADQLAPELDAIEAGYNETAGGAEFPRAKIVVVIDDQAIEQCRLNTPGMAMCFNYVPGAISAPSKAWFNDHYPLGWYTMTLAHEVGHAMGLLHADKGLMNPHGDISCVGREGACLYEAMALAGKVLLLPND